MMFIMFLLSFLFFQVPPEQPASLRCSNEDGMFELIIITGAVNTPAAHNFAHIFRGYILGTDVGEHS